MGMSGWRAYQLFRRVQSGHQLRAGSALPMPFGHHRGPSSGTLRSGSHGADNNAISSFNFCWPYIASLAASHIPVPAPVPASWQNREGTSDGSISR